MHRNALTRLHIAMLIATALVVIIGATITAAQERELLVPQPQSEMTIAELSEEVYDEVKSLHAFEAMPLPNSPERRRTQKFGSMKRPLIYSKILWRCRSVF